jgi:putative DNA primase/helicase
MPKPRKPKQTTHRVVTPDLIRSALACIPPDVDRETWARIGMAIKSEVNDTSGFDLWNEWSAQGETYDERNARDTWRSIKAGGKTTIATLFGIAKDRGFKFPAADGEAVQTPAQEAAARAEAERLAEKRRAQQAAEAAEYSRRADEAARAAMALWDQASDSGQSPYLARKGVQAHGVRFLPDGTLLVPMRNAAGELQNVQRIAPTRPSAEEVKAGKTEKRFLPGGRKSGLWHLVGQVEGASVLLLAEGYATAASVHEATGHPVAVAFDAGNLVHVARELRALLPSMLLLVCGDDDRETEARTGRNTGRDKAATAARAAHSDAGPAGVVFPQGLPADGSDFNDLAAHAGVDAVRELIEAAVASPSIPKARRAAKTGQGGPEAAAQGGEAGRNASGASSGPADGSDAGADESATAGRGTWPGRDPFELSDTGVYFIARDADGNEKPPLWLCAPLRVSARTRADDTNGWGCLLEFGDLDGNPKTWAMPSSLLSGEGAEWAARLRDMGLQMAPGPRARNLVAQYIDTRNPAERVTCTDRVGWHAGGIYVLPSGCIGGDEQRRYVFQSEAGMEDTFRRAGELADWQRRVASLCEGNSRLVFALGCAFAGPLLRLAGMESGGFHFRGDSSKGKTTALKVAASVWGRPTYMQRWRTTDNALEATAVQHCDGLLILDEIGQVDGRVVGDCAYLLANEQEKGRATRGGLTRKRRTWRLLFLSSGEKSMADHMAEAGKRVMAGQEVRLVDIPLDAGAGMGGLECLNGHESAGALAEAVTSWAARCYGTAGRAWLEWLAAGHEELPARIGELLDKHRAAIVPEAASEQVRRVGARFALVAVAGELAIEAGIAPWSPGHAAEAASSCFNAWLGARGHMDNGEDAAMLRQVKAFLEKNGDALFTWTHRAMDDHRGNTPLRSGFKRMVNAEGEPLKFDAATAYLERTGGDGRERLDASVEYLVFPEAFRREVAKGFDAKAVAELLRRRGHLKHEKDRLTIKHRLPGMDKAPVYHLKPSVFADDL